MNEDHDHKKVSTAHISNSEALVKQLTAELKSHAEEFVSASNPESLHQIRVTLRKIRALISAEVVQLDLVATATAKESIRWLSEITGPARDADVQLQKDPNSESSLPLSILEQLKIRRSESYTQIKEALVSSRFHDLLTFVAEIKPDIDDEKTTAILQKQIQTLLKKVLKRGPHLGQYSPDDDFHDLRKTLKKLRYTYGFFFQISESGKTKKIEKHFKLIQDYLGSFQDQTVRIERLAARSAELITDLDADHQELFDIGILIGESKIRIESMKAGFSDVFEKFEQVMNRAKNKRGKNQEDLPG